MKSFKASPVTSLKQVDEPSSSAVKLAELRSDSTQMNGQEQSTTSVDKQSMQLTPEPRLSGFVSKTSVISKLSSQTSKELLPDKNQNGVEIVSSSQSIRSSLGFQLQQTSASPSVSSQKAQELYTLR